MVRSFSFLLSSCFCFVVLFLLDQGTTGHPKKVSKNERYFDISEIPEYEILLWPAYSTDSKSSKRNKIQAIVDYSSTHNNTITSKKNKDGITSRPQIQGRITVNPNPEIIVIPVTVKPSQQIKPTLEVSAVAVTVKPNKSTTLKPKITTIANSVKSSTKPSDVPQKLQTFNKPQKPGQDSTNAVTKPTSSTQKNKVTPKPVVIQVTTVKPTNKPKPSVPQKIGQNSIRNTTAASLQAVQVTVEPTKATVKPVVTTAKPNKQKPQSSGPCNCYLGVCTCCSGPLLGLLSQKACIKVVYTPEDFAFDYSLMLNNRVLYQNKVSGKNPRPACIGIPRFNRIRLCARFSNVYFAGRNVHFCMGLEGRWDYEELFSLPFDCVRMGAQGFAILKPEEGGGIAVPGGLDSIIDVGGDDIGDYDENVVRNLFYY